MIRSWAFSVLLALAIATIAGVLAHAPALAHAGHVHGPAPTPSAPVVAVVVVDAALAQSESISAQSAAYQSQDVDDRLSGDIASALAEPEPDVPLSLAQDGPGSPSTGPCDGQCCTITACCAFAGPAALHAFVRPVTILVGSPRAGDRQVDGLEPDSLLRPPKSFV